MERAKQPVAWVTGGAGYIGSNVVRALRADGWRVVIFDNFSTGTRHFVPKGVKVFEGNLHTAASFNHPDYHNDLEQEGKPSVLVHLAAKTDVSWCEAHPGEAYKENASNTHAIAELAVEYGCKNMIFASSAAVYGDYCVYGKACKTTFDLKPKGVYGQTKLDAERVLEQYFKGRLNLTVLRMFNVAGAGCGEQFNISPRGNPNLETNALFPSMVRSYLNQGNITLKGSAGFFGTDYPVRDFIHVSDVAQLFLRAANMHLAGESSGFVFNVGRGKAINIKDLLQLTNWSKEEIKARVKYADVGSSEIMYSVAGGENVGDGAKRTLANMWIDEVRWQKSKLYQHVKRDMSKET